jgi:hypothetical protein
MAKGRKTGGRKTGTPNKVTTNVKEALEQAFEGLGGVTALIEWARKPDNRGDFYRLWGKLAPKPVELMGENGTPLTIRVVRE